MSGNWHHIRKIVDPSAATCCHGLGGRMMTLVFVLRSVLLGFDSIATTHCV